MLIAAYLHIRPWMLDDAFISFRYAHNFASGHGIVFNIGERVEGYTSFLWVVILAFFDKLGVNIVIVSKILGYLFSLGTILLLLFFPRKGKHISLEQILSALILATCGAFAVWGTSGMETMLFTFLLTLIFLLFERSITSPNPKMYLALGFLAALAALTRPEGVLIFLTLLLLMNLYPLLAKRRVEIRNLIRFIVPFVAIFGGHLLFRYLYYHDFLPNTFYDKVGSGLDQYLRGLRYTKQFFIAVFATLIPVTLWLIPCFRRLKENIIKHFSLFSALTIIGVFTLYIIYVGGDVMPAYRFFTGITPLLAIVSAFTIVELSKKLQTNWHTKNFSIIVASLSALLICAFNLIQWKINIKFNEHLKEDKVAEYGIEVGLYLKENFDNSTVIATNTAGSIPYYSGFYTIDMLGLNDKHIAKREMSDMGKGFPGHEKTDGAYILSRNPDIIQFGSSLGSKDPVLISDNEISKLSEFYENYELREYTLPSGRTLLLYELKDTKT